jgi:hypothetical protein
MPERAHGIDSTRFQLFPRHLDTKGSEAVPHRTIVLHELSKYLPWGFMTVLWKSMAATGLDTPQAAGRLAEKSAAGSCARSAGYDDEGSGSLDGRINGHDRVAVQRTITNA